MEKHCLSISQFTEILSRYVAMEPLFQDCFIEGELTNLKPYHLGKQLYFYLSDGKSSLNCVMYETTRKRLNFRLEEGMKVVIRAKVKIFPKRGQLMLQVNYLGKSGEGDLKKELEVLRQKLAREGLFDSEHKRPIPKYPSKVTMITAYESAAMWDFITLTRVAAPHIKLSIIPATVQGLSAPNSIIQSLNLVPESEGDLVVLMRGGGSSEDLACFNDEAVVRAIYDCPVPLISAVGHEVDVTLSDMVADLRAATPSNAAQLMTGPYQELKSDIPLRLEAVSRGLTNELSAKKEQLGFLQQQLDLSIQRQLERKKIYLAQLLHRLDLATPLHKMKQGFSITRSTPNGTILRDCGDVSIGDVISTQLSSGRLLSRVEGIE